MCPHLSPHRQLQFRLQARRVSNDWNGNPMKLLAKTITLILPTALLVAGIACAYTKTVRVNNGGLVYALDDPYIHMAMARNLSEHGVFGLTKYAFGSSSSSPLWTLLLSLHFRFLGPRDAVPGVLASAFAVGCLWVVRRLALTMGVGSPQGMVVGLAVVVFTPLVPLVATGMEHTMHLFLILVFCWTLVTCLNSPSVMGRVVLCVATMLATATRYESLFIVAPACALIFLQKKWATAMAVAISALTPVVGYGMFSVLNGSHFLPNSILLKGQFPVVNNATTLLYAVGYKGVSLLVQCGHLYPIGLSLVMGSHSLRKSQPIVSGVMLCLAVALILHLQYATVGWFYRYEGYLIAGAISLLGCGLAQALSMRLRSVVTNRDLYGGVTLLVSLGLVLLPLYYRAKKATGEIVAASHHVYCQQYQVAKFLAEMYGTGVRVAANDVGAISYYADINLLDLYGLGSLAVADALRDGRYAEATVWSLMQEQRADVVVVYADRFKGLLPQELVPVADWALTPSYYGSTVSFYGLSDESAQQIENRLREFEKRLPSSVAVSYRRSSVAPEHAGSTVR
jgi:hypothetical protein